MFSFSFARANALRLLSCAFFGFGVLASAHGMGEENHPAGPLASALESAWLLSPTAQGLLNQQALRQVEREVAGSWVAGSPTLGLSRRVDRSSGAANLGFSEDEVMLDTPVWWPAQRAARQAQAELASVELRAQIAQARLELAGQVRQVYWRYALASAQVHELEDHMHHVQDLAADTKRRALAGDLARSDYLLASQDVQQAAAQLQEARVAQRQARMHYLNLIGQEPPTQFPAELLLQATGDHPQIGFAVAAEQRAEAGLAVASQSRADNPSVGLSWRQEDNRLSPTSQAIGVHVQIPIGTDLQGQPKLVAAQAALAATRLNQRQQRVQLGNAIDLASQQLALTREALVQTKARQDMAREYLVLIQRAFDLGERAVQDVLRAIALDHEAASAHRQQQIKVNQAISELNQAIGVLP